MNTWQSLLRRPRALWLRNRHGSMLILTLILVGGLSLMIGVLMQATVGDMQLNERQMLGLESRDAVESATEYAMAVVRQRYDENAPITANYFIANPVTIPANISANLWSGTDVNPSNVTVTVGVVPSSSTIYIDPTNPANQFDPSRGQTVTACDVYVYASAIASNRWGISYSYGTQALEVRNTPLFNSAIFYNMDLELSPGSNMTISGPIHVNGNMWALTGATLTFTGPITCSGNFDMGAVPWQTTWGTGASAVVGSAANGQNINITGSTHNFYSGNGSLQSGSSYLESLQTSFNGTGYTNWRELSSNYWGGAIQTAANGVPVEQVSGYNNFVFNVNGSGQNLNYAYAMIEPAQSSYTSSGGNNTFNLGAGENNKLERNAGLIVKVLSTGVVNLTTSTPITGNVTNTTVIANANLINTTMTSNDFQLSTTVANFVNTTGGNYGNLVLASGVSASGNYMLANSTTGTVSGNFYRQVSNTHAFLLVTQTQNFSAGAGTSVSNQATSIHNEVTSVTAPTATAPNATNLMEVASAVYNSTTNTTTVTNTRYVGFAWVELDAINSTVNASGNLTPVYNGTTAVTDSFGDTIYNGDVTELPLQVNPAMITGTYNTNGTVTPGTLQDLLVFRPGIGNMDYSQSTGNLTGNTTSGVWNGLYDQRQGAFVSTVDLDTTTLKNILDNNAAHYATDAPAFFNGTAGTAVAYNPGDQYNGVVYVEFPSAPGNTSRQSSVTSGNTTYPGDNIIDSVNANVSGYGGNASAYGLVVWNGTNTGNATVADPGVPNPTYSNTSYSISGNAIGVAGRSAGFTLATNNMMYVKGNYNAVGSLTDGNSTTSDFTAYTDPVCCLAADAVTFLSGNWANYRSATPYSSGQWVGVSTVDNAALLTGIVPSGSYGNTSSFSGGVNNFPRFLEIWNGTFEYRGSMVALWASEMGNKPWQDSGSPGYYNPPTRNWGFYNQFSSGNYPPGTPNARSYYRVNFSYINSSTYQTDLGGL